MLISLLQKVVLHSALLVLLVIIGALCLVSAQRKDEQTTAADSTDTQLLEIGHAKQLQTAPTASSEFKVVSYNIRFRAGDDLRQMIRLFKEDPEIGGAAVLGLQEVDRNKKRTKKTNTVKLLADELGMYYAWTAPPPTKKDQKEEETGVAILSAYPLHDIRRLVLPHAGPGRRRRIALGATVKIGGTAIRIYSVHAENRIAGEKRLEQLKVALDDLATFPTPLPAMIMGDFNTWEPGAGGETKKLFHKANFKTPFDGDATFCQRILLVDVKFRLDWVWLRGLEPLRNGIDRDIDLSDHWPLWVVVKLKPEPVKSSEN